MTRSLHRLSFALILLPALGCGVQSMPLYTETDAGAAAGGQGGGQGGTGAGQTGGSGGSAGAQGGSGGSAGASGGTGGTAGTSGGTGGSAGASGGTGGPAGQGGVGGTYEVGEGESCGGFRPAPAPVCGKGLFCEMPAASCNIADAPGKCALVTSICPAIYNPVCGCDGKTYGSDCERRANRAQLAHQGECKRRVAQEGEMCAGIAGIQCADGLLCDPAPGLCKAADAGGTCKKFTPACTKEYAPVCGCDGNTYGNDCMRLNAKVAKKADGACERRSTTLAPGQWGGVGARLLVKDPNAGAAFELDCAHGTIDGPLEVTPDGQFKWKATLILEGGPVQDPPQPGRTRTAIFTGKTAGDTLSLQVIVDNAFAPPPALILTLGKEALLRKCL